MKKRLFFIYVFYLLMGIATNLAHPVTPNLVKELGYGTYLNGVLFSTMSTGLLFGGIFFGVLADKRPKKPFIVIGMIGYGIGQLMFGLFTTIPMLLIARFLGGFSISGAMTLVVAMISDMVPKEERAKVLSYTLALSTFGSTLGYKIGGLLGLTLLNEVFFIQFGANVLLGLFVLLVFENTISKESRRSTFFDSLKTIKQVPFEILIVLITVTIVTMAQFNVTRFLDVYVIELGYTTNDLGSFVLFTGFVSMFTNFVVVPFMSRFKRDFTFMLASMGLAVVAIAITINSTNFIVSLYSVFMLFYVANQIFQPFEQSFLANHFDSHHSIIMGLRQSFRAIGLIMAPLLGSALSLINIEYVFYLSITLYVVAGFMIYYVQRRLEN